MQSTITREAMPDYTGRIVAVWDNAMPEHIIQGMTWYPRAHDIATQIGKGDVRLGAGLIAALSPMTQWSLNLRNAESMARGLAVGALSKSVRKAERILAGEDFDTVLPRGSKTWNFAHNIAGSGNHVTIDRWAIRIALGWDKLKITDPQYRIIADSYRDAAMAREVSGPVMQAATWCAARGTGE
jgi:hypothetical protein